MKKFIAGLILLFFGTIGFVARDRILYYYPCATPTLYRLGSVDPRFNLSPSQAETEITTATNIWNRNYKTLLFKESPEAKLTVNFVYDERQRLSNQVQNLEDKVSKDKSNLDVKVAAFKIKVTAFSAKVVTLNSEIESWNAKGGAPKDVYDGLISRQQELKTEEAQIRSEGSALNVSVDNYNFQVGEVNTTVQNFNSVLSQKPEAGLYDGKMDTIYIYFVNNRDELVHTLAHEFGHALGINHTQDPQSLMYPYTNNVIEPALEDLSSLSKSCERVNNFDLLIRQLGWQSAATK